MNLKQQATLIIEALLFSSDEPLSLEKIQEILQTFYLFPLQEIKEMVESLKTQNHAYQLDLCSGGYLFRTNIIYRPYIEKLKGMKRREKLSIAAIEVLAIVSHKQPITRSSIEAIRGVDSSNVLHALIEKELIEQVGKEESPGRPPLYSVTKKFLQHFGLKDFTELKNAICAAP